MTDQEKRDFYKNCIAEMLNGVKRIDILQYVYIITENIIKEDKDVPAAGEAQP